MPRTPPRDVVLINNSSCQYPVIGRAGRLLGWSSTQDNAAVATDKDKDKDKDNAAAPNHLPPSPTGSNSADWFVYWVDSGQGVDRLVRTAKSFQKINHFPGMVEIYRKSNLARSMLRMQRTSSSEYDFFPKTWILPFEASDAARYLDGGGSGGDKSQNSHNRCIIVKPSGGAQGKGIYLCMSPRAIKADEDAVAQVYINKPLLIDGLKFDLRIYVLITCVDPLRILIYKEGLVRLCTTPYCSPDASNVGCTYMHLTNYSVNKHNTNFVQNDSTANANVSTASKRSLAWLWEWMRSSLKADTDAVWRDISDVVVKTLISIQPSLAQTYRSCKVDSSAHSPFTCFEVLGFDIMLTDSLKPCLIEVNHMPSFRTDSALDSRIKLGLIENTLRLLNVSADDRRKFLTRSAQLSQIRLYGSTFSSTGSGKGKAKTKPPRLESTSELWEKYEKNEAKNMGDFFLIYPTDVYANQVTTGKQASYENLLAKAQASIFSGGGTKSPQAAADALEAYFATRAASDDAASPRQAQPAVVVVTPPLPPPAEAASTSSWTESMPPPPRPRSVEPDVAQRIKSALLASAPLLKPLKPRKSSKQSPTGRISPSLSSSVSASVSASVDAKCASKKRSKKTKTKAGKDKGKDKAKQSSKKKGSDSMEGAPAGKKRSKKAASMRRGEGEGDEEGEGKGEEEAVEAELGEDPDVSEGGREEELEYGPEEEEEDDEEDEEDEEEVEAFVLSELMAREQERAMEENESSTDEEDLQLPQEEEEEAPHEEERLPLAREEALTQTESRPDYDDDVDEEDQEEELELEEVEEEEEKMDEKETTKPEAITRSPSSLSQAHAQAYRAEANEQMERLRQQYNYLRNQWLEKYAKKRKPSKY